MTGHPACVTVIDMELRRVEAADDEAIRAAVALSDAVNRVDAPWFHPGTEHRMRANVVWGWDLDPGELFVAYADGQGVALVEYATSRWDNPEAAFLHLEVHPDHRRRGHGSAIAEQLLARAKDEGRRLAFGDVWEDTGGLGFAERFGFERASQAIMRRQYPQELDPAALEKLMTDAWPKAEDYALERWTGRTPEDQLDELAEVSASINDAPLDDLELEDENYAPERVEAYETAMLNRGDRLYRVVARHRSTGRMGGHTVVVVEAARPAFGYQHDTAVSRDHRGHRLGLLLKAEMVRWMAESEPQLETIDTWNAESNDHMIAVNEQLDYRILGRSLNLQKRL